MGDNDVQRLYLDGGLIGSRSGTIDQSWWFSTQIGTGRDYLSVNRTGAGVDAWRHFSGSLDDVRIYNRALSAAEILQLYKSGAVNVAHSNVIISNGLVGYWTFDGGSIDWHTNTVSDMSGQGNTGTLISMSTTSSPVPGKIGQGFLFNGASNSYVDMGNVSTYNFGTGPFTYSLWIKGGDYVRIVIGKCTFSCPAGENGTQIFTFSGTYLYWNGSTSVPIGADDGKWHHLVVARLDTAAGDLKTYYDGALVTSDTESRTLSNSSLFRIAGASDNNGFLTGTMDDVRVYNRALSATEVKQLYNAGR